MSGLREQAAYVRKKWAEHKTWMDDPETHESTREQWSPFVAGLDAEAVRLDGLAQKQERQARVAAAGEAAARDV